MQNNLAVHKLNATMDAENFSGEPPTSKKSRKSGEGAEWEDEESSIMRVKMTESDPEEGFFRDEVAELIWNEIIYQGVLAVASDFHRACKTGAIPHREIMAPPLNPGPIFPEASPRNIGIADSGEGWLPLPASNRKADSIDVWGRIVPKEPPSSVVCVSCSRSISATRLGVHLDKCLGLGNNRSSSTRSMSK